MNLISVIIGISAALLALVGFLPLLGALNWLVMPVAFMGALIGAFGEKKTGLIVNLVVLAAGGFRLLLGGGIL